MTRTEALTALAENVMGWRPAWSGPVTPESRTIFFVASYEGTPQFHYLDPANAPDGKQIWTPFTDPAQALGLVEAWCDNRTGERGYEHKRYKLTRFHYVSLIEGRRQLGCTEESSLAAALTLAVCAAEGIEVEETETSSK